MSGDFRNRKGYMFITVLVAVVILSISMAVLLKSWSYRTKRMKENELLFRGKQYARAIQHYYQIHRRYPYTLEELTRTKPRMIRQLWKEPMTKNGEWGLVFLSDVQSGRLASEKARKLLPMLRVVGRDEIPEQPTPVATEEHSGKMKGQIVGVYSRSKDIPFLNYQKGKMYSDWKFMGIINRGNGFRKLRMGTYNPVR
ncbi:MAG: type II secretion system protein [Acidobacteria bacterium]|nr:type II secretion system protein [Acidobacteriota bacterium]